MASITLRIDERISKNGMSPVRIRISHRHTSAWYPTGVFIEPSCFQKASLYDPVSRKAYMAAEKREQLQSLVRKWDEAIFDLQRAEGGQEQMDRMNATELREYIFGRKVTATKPKASELIRKRAKKQSGDFMDFFDKYGSSRESERTREHFEYVLRVLYQYMQDRCLTTFTFRDITYERLTDLKQWIRRSGRGEVTRFKVESYIRAAYREGLRMKMAERADDPFLDYRIEKVPESDIVTISREELRTLMTVDMTSRPRLQRAQDILLASFYLCGANFIDMYDMAEPKDGEVSFIRHKVQRRTKKATHIRVEPELAAIIERYKGQGKMMHFESGFRSLQTRMDGHFRTLSELLGFKVSLEIIRRTWATMAGEIECPEIVIDKSMGHISRSVTARYYEQYDWSRTAKWNRRIIDYVMAA